jgi:hypothetical protein
MAAAIRNHGYWKVLLCNQVCLEDIFAAWLMLKTPQNMQKLKNS